ncbi:MAG: hypothetical protein ACD_54C00692G0001, partial [uncultured bacterium]
MQGGADVVLFTGSHNGLQRFDHLGFFAVKTGGEATLGQAERQISGADVNTIKTGRGGNCIQVRHALGGFDHGEG